MNRCLRCVIPDTRPDTEFVSGICTACHAFERRPAIDWEARREQLRGLLRTHDGRCIVPSSGGKDSTWQALTLIEECRRLNLKHRPTIVTARTCHLTEVGRANIDNLARFATTIEVVPNRTVRAKLNRLGLELVGDISWPEHAAIFSTPFRVAAAEGIKLIFYGENPQEAYGGPVGTDEARRMTARWIAEFGGFLGLRVADLVGRDGLTAEDLRDYVLPADIGGIEAHFLGQYIEWDSHRNGAVAMANGMKAELPSVANWWTWENLDNAQTGLHDHMMYRKYGFGRLAAQASVDVRRGLFSRSEAMAAVIERDGRFPWVYAGVELKDALKPLGLTIDALKAQLDRFTSWELFDGEVDWRPILKDHHEGEPA